MERLAQVSPQGHEMIVHVVTPENYWPLPWYLRRFNRDHVGYWENARSWAEALARGPLPSVLIVGPELVPAVDATLPNEYQKNMHFGLRPAVLVTLYVRNDLWQQFLNAAAIREQKPLP